MVVLEGHEPKSGVAAIARVRVRASVQQQRGDSEAATQAGKEQGVIFNYILRAEAGPAVKQAPSQLDVSPLRSFVQQRDAMPAISGGQALVLVHCHQHCSSLSSIGLLQELSEHPLAQARPRPRHRHRPQVLLLLQSAVPAAGLA